MVIEFLRFKIASQMREIYIQKDAEIWTTALAQYPGFLGKEVWLNPQDPTEIIFVVRWATKEQWQAIPPEELAAIEQKFAAALGDTYELVESAEYQQWLGEKVKGKG
ncbi:TIGR03792 family protein [Tolypothrix sp. PCC 7910]|uniref:TIGR03792 family protein n=1 Tax=Tolypothrix sp. PCC 7910 TaxID=2099387 RepID=UPI0014277231|nr:TIGR03792 family protein [Tolypothrix sp. PCC 7910]QIR41324.1 TIGR03792 family protein [Tolypothrix sp. PCC 7910]